MEQAEADGGRDGGFGQFGGRSYEDEFEMSVMGGSLVDFAVVLVSVVHVQLTDLDRHTYWKLSDALPGIIYQGVSERSHGHIYPGDLQVYTSSAIITTVSCSNIAAV